MRPRRVALVSLHFAEYAMNLALALAENEDTLLILYRDNAEDELGQARLERFSHPRLAIMLMERPKSILSIFANAKRLISAIKSFGPEVIHYQEDVRDELVLALPFLITMPTVLTVHDPVTHSGVDSTRFRFSRFRLYRFLMRAAADVAITHGSLLADALVSESPRFRDKVWSIPHGPLGIAEENRMPLYSRPCRLLFFGRIHQYKGLRYFVDAVIKLKNAGYPVVGVVAGRGSDLACNRQRMDAAHCFEVWDRYIPSAQVAKLFLTARVVVLPYTDGTQSGVAAMALGFGCPVVASAVGSIPDLVRDGRNGLLVPPCDVDALASAIRRVITDDQLWATLVNGALELRDGDLSWPRIANDTAHVYSIVAN